MPKLILPIITATLLICFALLLTDAILLEYILVLLGIAALVIILIPITSKIRVPWLDPTIAFSLFLVAVYLFFGPTYFATSELEGNFELISGYLTLESWILLLFVIPLALTFTSLKNRAQNTPRLNSEFTISSSRALAGLVSSAMFSFGYILLLWKNDLLFRRIGHQYLASVMLALPRYEFYFIRIFDRLALPLLVLFIITLQRTNSKYQPRQRKYITLSFLCIASAHFVNLALNSRLGIVQFFILGSVAYLSTSDQSHQIGIIKRVLKPKVILTLLLVIYLYKVALNAREGWFAEESALSLLNPLYEITETDTTLRATSSRINCVDLMAKMKPNLDNDGYSLGESWQPAFISTFGPIFAPDAARELKETLTTGAKQFLIREYTDLNMPDYESCLLTEVFGNFSVLSFIPTAILYALYMVKGAEWTFLGTSRLKIAIGLVMLVQGLNFETDFLSLFLFTFFQQIPVIFLLTSLNSLALKRNPSPTNVPNFRNSNEA